MKTQPLSCGGCGGRAMTVRATKAAHSDGFLTVVARCKGCRSRTIPPYDPVTIFASYGLTLVPASEARWYVKGLGGIHFVARYSRQWEFSERRGERWRVYKRGKRPETIAKYLAARLKRKADQ